MQTNEGVQTGQVAVVQTGQTMTTAQPMQVVTVVQVQPDSLEARFAKVQCCCGCNALGAERAIAILGFVFAIIGLVSLLDNSSLGDTSSEVSAIFTVLNVIEVIAAVIGCGAGIHGAWTFSINSAKIFMWYWILAAVFIGIDILFLLILCFIYPWIFIFLFIPFAILGLFLGLYIWFYQIARSFYLILVDWEAASSGATAGVPGTVPGATATTVGAV